MDAEARREVNRRNAQKSTGPKSPEGKARSRRNALKHGLTATVVDLDGIPGAGEVPEVAVAGERAWLVGQVDRVRAQIDRAGRVEGRLRDLAAWRAEALWDEDRRLDAEELGAALRRASARAVGRLRQTVQGCDWLLGRWRLLARAAEVEGAWTEDQARLAFDLLGTPEEGRGGDPGSGRAPLDLAHLAIAELEELRPDVEEADELEQILAANDLRDTPTPELARLRRYEAALHRRHRWLLDELRRLDPVGTPLPADPAPTTRAEPAGPAESATIDETKRKSNETKSILTEDLSVLASQPSSTPKKSRPDLDRLARRERKKRRRGNRSAC